jgi:hypothetical protein
MRFRAELGASRAEEQLRDRPADVTQLNCCCGNNRGQRKPPQALLVNDAVGGDRRQREADSGDKNQHFEAQAKHRADKKANARKRELAFHPYSPVSNIGDIWRLEERSDEGSVDLDIDEVCLDAIL